MRKQHASLCGSLGALAIAPKSCNNGRCQRQTGAHYDCPRHQVQIETQSIWRPLVPREDGNGAAMVPRLPLRVGAAHFSLPIGGRERSLDYPTIHAFLRICSSGSAVVSWSAFLCTPQLNGQPDTLVHRAHTRVL